ncbi:hypothetical protein M8J76_013641 [Diaphorina citri]|nr:hypothetical protein M8J75_005004 [Diaphorina citri]KAI5741442.1 hypothetical protein M8J76_013641 [Diaphorina citri]
MYNKLTLSVKFSNLFFCLKMFGLMHVNMNSDTKSDKSSILWMSYSYLLIAITIAATVFTFLNIEVNFFNIKNKTIEHKFIIVFVTLIIFHITDTVFVVASMFFSMKSNAQKILLNLFATLDHIHCKLTRLKRFQIQTNLAMKFLPIMIHLVIRLFFDTLTFCADQDQAFIKSKLFYFAFEVVVYFTYITMLLHDLFLVTLLHIIKTYFSVICDVILDLSKETSGGPPQLTSGVGQEKCPVFYLQEMGNQYKWFSDAHRVHCINPAPSSTSTVLSTLSQILNTHHTCVAACRRVNKMFNTFILSSVIVSFVGITLGCFITSLFVILLLKGFVTYSEAGAPIGLSLVHNSTLLFFLFRMVECCHDTKEEADRVLQCARQILVECKDVHLSSQVIGTVVTYWIILIQLQVILLKL